MALATHFIDFQISPQKIDTRYYAPQPRRTMFEMAPKRSKSNFGWQPFFSSNWQTFNSKTLQFYYVKLTSHNFWINADKRKIF